MARNDYNTFVVQDCKSGEVLLVTSSARKARGLLQEGTRIDVWNCNERVKRIVKTEESLIVPYVEAEREYIRAKQERATRKAVKKWRDPEKK